MRIRRRPPEPLAAPKPDPFVPWKEHDELRAAVDPTAAQDARRHAETLLDRPLPYAGQVSAQAAERLERVGMRRLELLAHAEAACDAAGRRAEHERSARAAAEAALEAAGVPGRCFALEPHRGRLARRVLAAVGLRSRDQWDDLDGLFRRRAAAAARLLVAETELAAAERRIVDVRAMAAAVGRAEIALATELVERYRAGLVHHLPPLALADGAEVAEQTVDVPRPDWLEAEPAEEALA